MGARQPRLPEFGDADPNTYPLRSLQDLPLCERPAQRVAAVGVGGCALHELLAAIVGGPRQVEIAYSLLARYRTLGELSRTSVEELARTGGVGRSRAAALHAALELARRLQAERPPEGVVVRSPADVAGLLMARIGHLEQEHFVVLFLNTRNRLLGQELLYKGSLNASHIRLAEVFREAARRNCAALLVSHNHPSGDVAPSPEDVTVTRQIVQAGEVLDIEVLDHLVVSAQRYVSLRERGLGFDR
jgi:DNA repair protein RadC